MTVLILLCFLLLLGSQCPFNRSGIEEELEFGRKLAELDQRPVNGLTPVQNWTRLKNGT